MVDSPSHWIAIGAISLSCPSVSTTLGEGAILMGRDRVIERGHGSLGSYQRGGMFLNETSGHGKLFSSRTGALSRRAFGGARCQR